MCVSLIISTLGLVKGYGWNMDFDSCYSYLKCIISYYDDLVETLFCHQPAINNLFDDEVLD